MRAITELDRAEAELADMRARVDKGRARLDGLHGRIDPVGAVARLSYEISLLHAFRIPTTDLRAMDRRARLTNAEVSTRPACR